MSGLVLSSLTLDAVNEPQDGDGGNEPDDGTVAPVKPITADESEGADREREFLNEIIERINQIFGDLAPEDDQKSFTAQVATTASKNAVIADQVEHNPKHQVMQGDLPKEVAQAVIQAMGANDAMARVLLADKQCMSDFVGVIYDLVKSGGTNNFLAK